MWTIIFAFYCVINKTRTRNSLYIINSLLLLTSEHYNYALNMNKFCIFITYQRHHKTKIAPVLLNTWGLVLDLPKKMFYIHMYTLVIFFNKLWHFLNYTNWSPLCLLWKQGKWYIATLLILPLRTQRPSVYTLYRILVS